MQRHLFLCAPSGSGVSAMIRNALGQSLPCAGGFITERVCADDGRLLGMDLLPSAAAAGVEGFDRARFIDFSHEPPARDNEVFRVEAVRLLREAVYYPYVLLDEIGGFEMVIPQFRAALSEFLSSPVPCIGLIKTRDEAEALRQRLGLGERYPELVKRMRAALDYDEDTLVLDTAGAGDPAAEKAVRQWAEIYAR